MTLLDLPVVRADALAAMQMCGLRPGGSLDRSPRGHPPCYLTREHDGDHLAVDARCCYLDGSQSVSWAWGG